MATNININRRILTPELSKKTALNTHSSAMRLRTTKFYPQMRVEI
jgi:hypothetical protein